MSHIAVKKKSYKAYTNSNNSDEEEIRFCRKKNINTIALSDSNSDIDKYNCNNSECNKDIINEILQELVESLMKKENLMIPKYNEVE